MTYTSHIGFDSEAIRSVIPVVNQLWQSVILDGSACLDEIHHKMQICSVTWQHLDASPAELSAGGGDPRARWTPHLRAFERRGPTCEQGSRKPVQRKPECMLLVLQMQQPAEAFGLAERLSFRTAVCLDMLSCIVLMSRMPMTCSISARKLLPANKRHSGSG